MRKIKEMHCYTEVGNKSLANDRDAFSAAKRLGKGKPGDGRHADGKDEASSSNNYTLPDGSKIEISNSDKARAPEILFKPSLIGLEYPGIHELVVNCIKACDIDLRTALQSSVIVAGSTTLMKSFCQRLHKSILQSAARPLLTRLTAAQGASRQPKTTAPHGSSKWSNPRQMQQ